MQTLEKTHPKLQELKTRLAEVNDIESAASLLYWDQATYMPPGGAAARGRQIATLRHIAHTKFTNPEIGQILEDLRDYQAECDYNSDEASLIRIARHDYDRFVISKYLKYST